MLSLRRATILFKELIHKLIVFLSTLSLWRATVLWCNESAEDLKFLSTLSLWRATLTRKPCCAPTAISIHALLAESDEFRRLLFGLFAISIHALLAESDVINSYSDFLHCISIHALLAESDLHCKTPITFRHYFYPRSPCGERLNSSYGALDGASISIHALLAESDTFLYFLLSGHLYFYPRSPCGERLVRVVLLPEPFLPFLSTLSLRRATAVVQPLTNNSTTFLSTLSLRRATFLPM